MTVGVVLSLLSLSVLLLTAAVVALYRSFILAKIPLGGVTQWPFAGANAGQAIHHQLGVAADYSGFVLVCSDRIDGSAAFFSVGAVAQESGYPLTVSQLDSERPTGWLPASDRYLSFAPAVAVVSASEVAALKPITLPACVFLVEGRAIEASATLQSPSLVAQHFQYVAPQRSRSYA